VNVSLAVCSFVWTCVWSFWHDWDGKAIRGEWQWVTLYRGWRDTSLNYPLNGFHTLLYACTCHGTQPTTLTPFYIWSHFFRNYL